MIDSEYTARHGGDEVSTRAYRYGFNRSSLPRGTVQLTVENVTLRFGNVVAVKDVSLDVRQGEIHAIIGPNGAGKTSLLNCISGLYSPQQGRIVLHDDEHSHHLIGMRPHAIARHGIARSFQNIELFKHMSVLDNLMLGCHVHMRGHVLSSLWYWGAARRREIQHRERVEEIIDLLEIQAVRHQPVSTLAYGLQKRVEFGRALCLRPAILVLDEPMAGMNVEEKEDVARFVLDINDLAGVTVVLIEHDMEVVMDVSTRVSVLDFGTKIVTATPDEVRSNPAVIDAYLGRELESA